MQTSTSTLPGHDNSHNDYRFALTALTSLFFMWGFITCLNDILVPHLKMAFKLSYTQSMLIQFCFFGAYFITSIPAGFIVKKVGYQYGIVTGLCIAALGCLLFYPAASIHSYALFLAALFVLASGITLLQVSANPYVTLLGPARTASSRLTMTQAFNSLGTTVAPYLGALLILQEATLAMPHADASSVKQPYLALMALLLLLAALFAFIRLPVIKAPEPAENNTSSSAWQNPNLVLGAVGIFVYVGAEVSIGSFIVSFLGLPHIAGFAENDAAKYLTYYWGGAMVGRFIGATIMQKVSAGKVLTFNACSICLLLAITVFTAGPMAMWALLLVGFFNSIMFPTIFSLALSGLGKNTSQGSGILCLAIVGGAFIPLFQGFLADRADLQVSFTLPIACYIYIAWYGYRNRGNSGVN